MRYLTGLFGLVLLSSSALASPFPTPVRRDDVSDAVNSAVPIVNELGTKLETIFDAIKNDPLLTLTPYEDNSRQSTYDIPTELSSAFTTAITNIQDLPSIPTSSDPAQAAVDAYGPLIKAVTLSVFYSGDDFEYLTQLVLEPLVPGYTEFAKDFDLSLYAFVLALNAKFEGFADQLGDEIGSDTALGQAIKVVGNNLFALIFDHIDPGSK